MSAMASELNDLSSLLLESEEEETYREASACRSNSSEEKSHPSQVESPTCWWSPRLKELTETKFLPSNPKPLTVISGCTGISAESEVLEARQRHCH